MHLMELRFNKEGDVGRSMVVTYVVRGGKKLRVDERGCKRIFRAKSNGTT
jgi:hypothetical protein